MGLMLALTLAAAAGCRSSGPPGLDDAVARESLTTVLEAWKEGKRPASLREGTPEIIASDPDWEGGARLVSYRVSEPVTNDGANLHVPVELELEDGSGKRTKQTTVYIVGTNPKITVFPK
jgi:hypothetical protein